MGNSSSQQPHGLSPAPHWAHSYPRPRQIRIAEPHCKVLPERLPPLRLRTTDNGAILHNGGTISGRKQEEERMRRPRSSSAHRAPKPEDIHLDKGRFGSEPDLRFTGREVYEVRDGRDHYGENGIRQRISRSKKKNRAPPVPQHVNGSGMDSSSPDLNGWDTHAGDTTSAPPNRKARLFKTRAETTKRNTPGNGFRKSEMIDGGLSRSTETLNVLRAKPVGAREDRPQSTNGFKVLHRSTSHEAISSGKGLSTPEFQAELLEAAQRLRPRSALLRQPLRERGSPIGTASQSPKIQPPARAKEIKETSRSHEEVKREVAKKSEVPAKTFYFGMEENNNEVSKVDEDNVVKTNKEHRMTAVEKSKNLMNAREGRVKSVLCAGWEDREEHKDAIMEKFAASFHKQPTNLPNGNTTSCSSSFVSDADDEVDGGIALQLRPTLPKKQLEIPRFSPTAAWRLLSSVDTAPSPVDSDDSPALLEDRIRAPLSQGLGQAANDKSGDSGISGDASPGGCHESASEVAMTVSKSLPGPHSKSLLMAWTPQQDLEEESSSDDLESPLHSSKTTGVPGAKFSTRGQLFASREQPFSLTLPREDRQESYPSRGDPSKVDPNSRFHSLKKLKGALGAALGSGKRTSEDVPQDSNWVLSRSVPSSLNNGHAAAVRSISNPPSPEHDEETSAFYQQSLAVKFPSYSYLVTGGRMMYLPEYQSRFSPDANPKRTHNSHTSHALSKSCENISGSEMRQLDGRTPSPVVSQMANHLPAEDQSPLSGKKKKFTFQSTVRLIENRRLADRLSREAELKENQRLGELEAMKKVEEEFQRKRAREKANIRHQLRLFSLEEQNYCSLPPLDWEDPRAEPDGAPSSLPPSQQTQGSRKSSNSRKSSGQGGTTPHGLSTQVLSEYREPMRDYRDYRHPRYHEVEEAPVEPTRRSVVEHPRVVYDMPKNTAVYVSATAHNQYGEGGVSTPRGSSTSDNYRKDFAHGVPVGGRSLASSDSELSQTQSHTRPTSRQRHRMAAVQRSRSASPMSTASRSCSPAPRSASASPLKIVIRHTLMERSHSPERVVVGSEHVSVVTCSSSSTPGSVQLSLSQPSSLEMPIINQVAVTNEECQEEATPDLLPRNCLTSLTPFNKTSKGYRPIAFNPANKLAQMVS